MSSPTGLTGAFDDEIQQRNGVERMHKVFKGAKRNTKVNTTPHEQGSVTDKLRALIRQAGGKTLKLHGGPMSSGQPDIFGCLMGYTVVIETKRQGAAGPTDRQKENVQRWAQAGAIAFWTDHAEAGMMALLQEIVRRDNTPRY